MVCGMVKSEFCYVEFFSGQNIKIKVILNLKVWVGWILLEECGNIDYKGKLRCSDLFELGKNHELRFQNCQISAIEEYLLDLSFRQPITEH